MRNLVLMHNLLMYLGLNLISSLSRIKRYNALR